VNKIWCEKQKDEIDLKDCNREGCADFEECKKSGYLYILRATASTSSTKQPLAGIPKKEPPKIGKKFPLPDPARIFTKTKYFRTRTRFEKEYSEFKRRYERETESAWLHPHNAILEFMNERPWVREAASRRAFQNILLWR